MCVRSNKICVVLLSFLIVHSFYTVCNTIDVEENEDASGLEDISGSGIKEISDVIAEANAIEGKSSNNDEDTNSKQTIKRENVRLKNASDLIDKAEDILMDEIQGSDQAANRAEIAYNIPKEMEYLDSTMKAGDIHDTDTENMIGFNEKKGAYLPVLTEVGTSKGTMTKKLTDQFRNVSGLPDFILKAKDKIKARNVSLVEKVAESLQPKESAISGIKQLLEEHKVEQSLKKGLDIVPRLGESILNQEHDLSDPVDNRAVSVFPLGGGTPLSQGYITPVNPEQIFDESVSPPEQLLDELSTGKFKHPLPESVLNKMSNWNANKEYLIDNGFLNQRSVPEGPKLSRVSSELLPVHDVFLKNKAVVPTSGIPRGQFDLIRNDPEILGRNQGFLNGDRFHSMSDLDSIGPPIYPASVVRLPQRPRHVYLPVKHRYAHLRGVRIFADEGEGHHPHHRPNHGHWHHVDHDDEETDDYYADHIATSARCSYKPCVNGGKCTALIDKYICTCREGFAGINCEKRSFCHPNPCKHGSCSENVDDFVCTCSSGWQGKRCDEKDKCHPSPCMHGGTCSSTFSGVYCSCPPGFKGAYCESEAKCTPLNPCVNGGRCQEFPFSYMCICKNGFSGSNCEVVLSPTKQPPTVPMKPVPPQAIPAPHDQPPFLLEELNSLSDGPLEGHPVPETHFETVTTQDENRVVVDGGHVHAMFNDHHDHHDYYDHHDHDQHLVIESSPSVVIHTGDPSKEPKKNNNGKFYTGAKNRTKPPDAHNDDRYQTHLVAAALMKGKPVSEEGEGAQDKKPPIETAEQVKAKPTQKEEKPKQLVPTAEILKRLENPHPIENQIKIDTPKTFFNQEIGDLVRTEAVNTKPFVKNEVVKNRKSGPKIKPTVQQRNKKVSLSSQMVAKPTITSKLAGESHMIPLRGTPKLVCPGFCKMFCDKWCVDVGCCKKVEVNGPSAAFQAPYPKGNSIKGIRLCEGCSENANCNKGKCQCKKGFIGDGKYCTVDPCVLCDDNAKCIGNHCECNVGFFGNGKKCTKFSDHCSRCSPSADCFGTFCLCKPGYYGNGNDCWPLSDPTL